MPTSSVGCQKLLKVAEITKEQVDLEIKNANQEISKKIVPGFSTLDNKSDSELNRKNLLPKRKLCDKNQSELKPKNKKQKLSIQNNDCSNYTKTKSSPSSDSGFKDTMSTSSYTESTQVVVNNLNDSINRKNVSINRNDLATLIGTSLINDNVFNFYLDLIQKRSQDNPSLPQVHCFNTNFLSTFLSRGYKAVRRWTKKVDIFQKDILIIPCHVSSNHWTLAVVDFNKKTITYYDSMGGKDYGLLCRITSYLHQESWNKRKLKFDLPGWKISCLEKRSPQQTNNYDCGVFAMVTAELISRKKKISFSQDDIQAYRKQIYSEFFNGKLCQ